MSGNNPKKSASGLSEEDMKMEIELREQQNPSNFINPNTEGVENKEISVIIDDIKPANQQNLTLEQRHELNVSERQHIGDDGRLKMTPGADPYASEIHGANDGGWKNIPLHTLPSKGMFYPDGTEITIRAATVAEIRQWSTIDDGDFLDMDDKLNFIIEKCLRMKHDSGIASWKDIKEIDRFYLVFRIHEMTFPNGENKLTVHFSCTQQCGYDSRVQLTSAHLHNMFTPKDSTMRYYNPEKKCFSKYSQKLGEEIVLHVPSLGTMMYIKKEYRESKENGKNLDTSFIRLAPFFVSDWRKIKPEAFEALRHKTYQWNQNKFLFISAFIDEFKKGVVTKVEHQCERCDAVLERPLFFRDGFTIKDLFTVSSQFDDLV